MAQPTGGKQTTILSLSEDIRQMLLMLQVLLNKHFNRNVLVSTPSEPSLQNPNVLDEIIETLEAAGAHLARITKYIESEVLPKIN